MILVSSLVLAACDDGGGPLDATVGPLVDGAAPGRDAGDPSRPDGGGPLDGGEPPRPDAGPPPLRVCRTGCMTAADCVLAAGLALYDAEHYTCVAGICEWSGCRNAAECREAFMRPDYVCRLEGGFGQCLVECAASSDCGVGSAAFDADNYSCDDSVCVYTGCNTDDECVASFSDARYVCRDVEPPSTGLPIPVARRNCVLGCASGADCRTGSPAFDDDNYECRAGACVYTGCNDDAECAAAFMSTRYVCR